MLPTFLLLFLAVSSAATADDLPRVILRATAGLPNLLGAGAEVFVGGRWSVEAGGGFGLLPPAVSLGSRWSPERTCWGCGGGHAFRLSPGATAYIFPTQPKEGLGVLNLDASWLWWEGGFGFTAGLRAGAGIAWGDAGIEPGIELIPLQLGVLR